MQFETEYKLEQFRKEQESLFDKSDKRYKATPISDSTAELMLQLINFMENEIKELEHNENIRKI